jgi:hypothetical protein
LSVESVTMLGFVSKVLASPRARGALLAILLVGVGVQVVRFVRSNHGPAGTRLVEEEDDNDDDGEDGNKIKNEDEAAPPSEHDVQVPGSDDEPEGYTYVPRDHLGRRHAWDWTNIPGVWDDDDNNDEYLLPCRREARHE